MNEMTLRLTLLSATTFGRGDGVAGFVDREIEHDSDGFPYLRGKTLKGLLAEAAENVVYALEAQQRQSGWQAARLALFGQPGRGRAERGILHVGDACLPETLQKAILVDRAFGGQVLQPHDVLYALTGVRRQTAMNPAGGPEHHTLRTMRVLLPDVVLEAPLSFEREADERELGLLAAAVLDFRRAGTGRNRGRGHLRAELNSEQQTRELFNQFNQFVEVAA